MSKPAVARLRANYIHVADLCRAHLLALEYLVNGGESDTLNLGNGAGYSVQAVLDAVKKVTGRRFELREAPRRPGDPAWLIADASLAREVLGWVPEYGLEEIIRHAWAWEQTLAGARLRANRPIST